MEPEPHSPHAKALPILLATVLVALGSGAGLGDRAYAAEPTNQIKSAGQTRLSDLGFSTADVVQSPDRGHVSFAFPPGAEQGPDNWYLLNFHFEVEIGADSDGIALVSAATNDRSAAQVQFETHPGQSVKYSSLSLIAGRTESTSESRVVDVRFSNYLQQQGVAPGPAQFSVSLEQIGGARISRVTLFSDTSFEATRSSPFSLSLTPAKAINPTPTSGRPFYVTFTLRVQQGRPVDSVAITATASNGLEVVSPARQDIGSVGDIYQGRFQLIAKRAGEYEVGLHAQSSINRPAATVRVRVVEDHASRVTPLFVAFATVLAGVVLILLAGPLRARLRRRSQVRQ